MSYRHTTQNPGDADPYALEAVTRLATAWRADAAQKRQKAAGDGLTDAALVGYAVADALDACADALLTLPLAEDPPDPAEASLDALLTGEPYPGGDR